MRTFRQILSASFLLVLSAAGAQAQSITLAWNANPETNISNYVLYYGTGSNNYPNSINVGNSTSRTVTGLTPGARYYFALKAVNSSGLQSAFSSEVNAVAPLTPTAAPATPSAPSPANNATGISTGTSLTWNASGATSYTVRFGTTNPPPQAATGLTTASYRPSALSANTRYYWQIVATNSVGSTTGSVWSFTTSSTSSSAPAAPSSPSPANNKGGVRTLTSLTWSASGATSYTVRFGVSTPPPDVATVTSASYSGFGNLDDGRRYYWQIIAHNSAGSTAGPVWQFKMASSATNGTMSSDFDGDGQSDYTVYRPSAGLWYNLRSSSSFSSNTQTQWGTAADIPVPGDYDGNGSTDLAVYRPATGDWYIKYTGGSSTQIHWGVQTDIPVPGDYDGDGITDLAVYRGSTGEWYIRRSSGSPVTLKWGLAGDVPVTSDYDGDGLGDLAMFRPSSGWFYVLTSSTNYTGYTQMQWGMQGDTPVTGDFDKDGRADLAVYRPAAGEWWVLQSSTSNWWMVRWGEGADIPVAGDFDGDGFSDVAVWRPSTGVWAVLKSSSNFQSYSNTKWGMPGDIPVAKAP